MKTMKFYKWLVLNDEKRYYYIMTAKNVSTLRRRVNSQKETVIGRVDKLGRQYADVLKTVR